MQSTEILKVENIKKNLSKKPVLNLQNQITIQKGEIYGLIGPNGAGKSTLMKIISSLTKADSGYISLFNQILNDKNKIKLLKHMGIFIEGPSYYGHLSGYENMKILQNLKNLTDNDIDTALEYVGLSNQKNKKVDKYSLGMKQRLGLAMALAGLPPFMILDEPTNGLDPQGMKEIRNLILHLAKNKGITILISSHILGELEKIVDHIGIINKGELLYQGTITHFKNRFGSEIAFKTSDNEKALDIIDDLNPKIEKDYIAIKNISNSKISFIAQKLLENNIELYRIFDISKSLEDLFIELTGKGSL